MDRKVLQLALIAQTRDLTCSRVTRHFASTFLRNFKICRATPPRRGGVGVKLSVKSTVSFNPSCRGKSIHSIFTLKRHFNKRLFLWSRQARLLIPFTGTAATTVLFFYNSLPCSFLCAHAHNSQSPLCCNCDTNCSLQTFSYPFHELGDAYRQDYGLHIIQVQRRN